jgi:hypothetical protein
MGCVMFVKDKNDARQFFFQVWDKMSQQVGLEPLELVISDIIKAHPEHHEVLRLKDLEFSGGSNGDDGVKNPFLHMGLHIALVEQLQTDRPTGIRGVFQELVSKYGKDVHRAEHLVMSCLAEILRVATVDGHAPDEQEYLKSIRKLI